jgi:hypothetical protein
MGIENGLVQVMGSTVSDRSIIMIRPSGGDLKKNNPPFLCCSLFLIGQS